MARQPYFTREAFGFLVDLSHNNNKEWFLENKGRFEKHLRDPFLALIGDLVTPVRGISKHLVVDARAHGGSMMRIHRDTRFSKDKSPYKTNVAAQFEHAKGGDGAAPGLYLHLAPGGSATGAGIWHPEPVALKQIRDAIVAKPKAWQAAVRDRAFKSGCGFIGESLKRPPAGYDPSHPLVEDLKRKDFAISIALSDKQVFGAGLLDDVVDAFHEQARFLRFVVEALGLPP